MNKAPYDDEWHQILLSAWILSCTDKVPQITFRGIRERLSLSDDIELEKIVLSRSELFRHGIPTSQLNQWKKEMKRGKMRPAWLAKHSNKSDIIEEFSKSDLFRNRFRNALDAEPAPIEIIEWGLNHLENLRKLNREEDEIRIRKWTSFWIPALSIALAMFSLFATVFNNYEVNQLKQYEISIQPKQQGYYQFMTSLNAAFEAAKIGISPNLNNSLQTMEIAYYQFSPHISESDANRVFTDFLEYSAFCHKVCNEARSLTDSTRVRYRDNFIDMKLSFKNRLAKLLFYDES